MTVSLYDHQRDYLAENPTAAAKINSYVAADLVVDIEYSDWYESAYKTAYIAVMTLFIVGTVAGLMYLAAVNPDFLLYGIGALSFSPMLVHWISSPMNAAQEKYSIGGAMLRQILETTRELENASADEYTNKLNAATPNWNRTQETTEILSPIHGDVKKAYLPALARHQFWVKEAEKANNAANRCIQEANQLRNELNQAENITPYKRQEKENTILKKLHEAYKIEEVELLPAKIKAAFMIYVLQNPLKVDGEAKDLEDFGEFKPLNLSARRLLQVYEERDPYYTKKDGTSIARVRLLENAPQIIAQEIFGTTV